MMENTKRLYIFIHTIVSWQYLILQIRGTTIILYRIIQQYDGSNAMDAVANGAMQVIKVTVRLFTTA